MWASGVPEGPAGPGDGALGLQFRAELSTKERLGGEFNYTVMLDGTTEIVIRSEEDLPTGQLLDFFVSREDLYAFHENEERIPLEELPAESEGTSYTLTLGRAHGLSGPQSGVSGMDQTVNHSMTPAAGSAVPGVCVPSL